MIRTIIILILLMPLAIAQMNNAGLGDSVTIGFVDNSPEENESMKYRRTIVENVSVTNSLNNLSKSEILAKARTEKLAQATINDNPPAEPEVAEEESKIFIYIIIFIFTHLNKF